MFNVTTVNLTPDLRTAGADLGGCDFGAITGDQLTAILENFRLLDPLQNHEAEPQVIIETHGGKFLVRTGQGKLFLYNARDQAGGYVELDCAGIVRELSQLPPQPAEEPLPTAPAPQKSPHRGIAATILVCGLLLNGYTLYSVFYIDDVNRPPPVTLVTDATEIAAFQQSAAGRYATGNAPGDRIIIVSPDGRVRFLRVIAAGERPDSDDTYRVGRQDTRLCLLTPDSGLIEIVNINTLTYYRDSYRRVR